MKAINDHTCLRAVWVFEKCDFLFEEICLRGKWTESKFKAHGCPIFNI